MARAIGVATLSFTDVLERHRPDLLLLIGDRYEMVAPATVALALRIPIAHIEGGEASEWAIDQAVRNAITMMSHVHLTTTRAAAGRLEAMGEEAWRIHRVGAPSLDHLRRGTLPSPETLRRRLGLHDEPTVVVALHPVTLARDTTGEVDAVLEALSDLEKQIVFCFPNADAGGRALIDRARGFCGSRRSAHLVTNLEPPLYWALLRDARLMIGNSSSGIMESASIPLPAIDVGRRQQGRERARNVVDAEATPQAVRHAIDTALSVAFQKTLTGLENPYGDGHAGPRIARVLAEVPLESRLLVKPAPWHRTSPGPLGATHPHVTPLATVSRASV